MKPDEGDINWLKQTGTIPDFFLLFSLKGPCIWQTSSSY